MPGRTFSEDVDWHRIENTTDHRTNNYKNSTLILRRGQPFKFTARLNRSFDPARDKVKLQLRFGSNPDRRLGTEIIAETIPENNTWTPSWFLEIKENDGNLIVTVHSPPDALIGRYKVKIYIESVNNGILALGNESGKNEKKIGKGRFTLTKLFRTKHDSNKNQGPSKFQSSAIHKPNFLFNKTNFHEIFSIFKIETSRFGMGPYRTASQNMSA